VEGLPRGQHLRTCLLTPWADRLPAAAAARESPRPPTATAVFTRVEEAGPRREPGAGMSLGTPARCWPPQTAWPPLPWRIAASRGRPADATKRHPQIRPRRVRIRYSGGHHRRQTSSWSEGRRRAAPAVAPISTSCCAVAWPPHPSLRQRSQAVAPAGLPPRPAIAENCCRPPGPRPDGPPALVPTPPPPPAPACLHRAPMGCTRRANRRVEGRRAPAVGVVTAVTRAGRPRKPPPQPGPTPRPQCPAA
jgi:hypothetical protein